MHLLRILRNRLRALLGRDVVVDEIHEEIQFHLDERIVEHERRGPSPEEALAAGGAIAAWIPARRAARVDPVVALRGD